MIAEGAMKDPDVAAVFGFLILIAVLHGRLWQVFELYNWFDLVS